MAAERILRKTGKFTVAAMCQSRTLKPRQPADSHWLDNVSPSFLPLLLSPLSSLVRRLSPLTHWPISLASAFTRSLLPSHPSPPCRRSAPLCFCFASVSSLQAGPWHSTLALDPAPHDCPRVRLSSSLLFFGGGYSGLDAFAKKKSSAIRRAIYISGRQKDLKFFITFCPFLWHHGVTQIKGNLSPLHWQCSGTYPRKEIPKKTLLLANKLCVFC